MITQADLEGHGWLTMQWNGGITTECYWPLDNRPPELPGHPPRNRLSVRFNERTDRPFSAWLFVVQCGYELPHIQSMDELNQLILLLSRR